MIALTNNFGNYYDLKHRTRYMTQDGILRLHHESNQRLLSRYGTKMILPLIEEYVDIADYWAEEHALTRTDSSDRNRTEATKQYGSNHINDNRRAKGKERDHESSTEHRQEQHPEEDLIDYSGEELEIIKVPAATQST